MRSINFPNNLSLIGNSAFCDCSALTSISLPSNLSTLGYQVFYNCSNLSSITWNAWKGDISLPDEYPPFTNVSSKGTVTVTNPSGYSDIDLLSYLVENAGLPESWLPQGELPESVYRIENNILKGFTSEFLANPSAYRLCDTMEIPANVTSIEESAFIDDPTAEQPNSTIPSFITKLTFAKGSQCSTIGQSAFRASGTSGQEPGEITYIDLSNCTNLLSIGQSGFCRRNKLTSIKFPNNLSSIGMNSFGWCYSLTTVNLSNCNNLSLIDRNAFTQCSKLTSVVFPSSLTEIGMNAFNYCVVLNSIIWDGWSGNTTCDYAFSSYSTGTEGCTILSLNPIDNDHNSAALLQYLIDNGNLNSERSTAADPELN